MNKLAVIKISGKQYLVKEGEELIVDHLYSKEGEIIEISPLALIDLKKEDLEVGESILKKKVKIRILKEKIKGDKIRVSRFKAKVRYRRVKGFRPTLTKIKVEKI